MKHLLVAISAHGFGHLSQTAPVLDALQRRCPGLRMTVRSALPAAQLRRRLSMPFDHICVDDDFGFVMHNAIDIDCAASAARYREMHACWAVRVADETARLRSLQVDAVLSNIAYVPLAAAAQVGVSAAAMCSLNWAEMFATCFSGEPWATAIHAQMHAAYRAADVFLRVTPGLEMQSLGNIRPVGPIARVPTVDPERRGRIARQLSLPERARWVLVAMGGMDFRQPVENWPLVDGIYWLLPAQWGVVRSDVRSVDSNEIAFIELLAAADAVLTKPGYGTFVEAACSGTSVVYVGRDDWPEEAMLAQWIAAHGCAARVSRAQLARGELHEALASVWQAAPEASVRPVPSGIDEAVEALLALLC
jgi:hypothetical protein